VEKSLPDIISTPSAAGAAKGSMAERSRPSRKSDKKPSSKGAGLSDSILLDIFMADLNRLQERFGETHFFRIPGDDEPAGIVLPKTLEICEVCGLVIVRGKQPFCDAHLPLEATLGNAKN